MIPSQRTSRAYMFITLTGVMLLTTACAATSSLTPHSDLLAARTAIADAERADAARYGSEELSEAREKLHSAHSAAERNDMARARMLARESQATAELAVATAEAWKAEAANQELQQSTSLILRSRRTSSVQE